MFQGNQKQRYPDSTQNMGQSKGSLPGASGPMSGGLASSGRRGGTGGMGRKYRKNNKMKTRG